MMTSSMSRKVTVTASNSISGIFYIYGYPGKVDTNDAFRTTLIS